MLYLNIVIFHHFLYFKSLICNSIKTSISKRFSVVHRYENTFLQFFVQLCKFLYRNTEFDKKLTESFNAVAELTEYTTHV